MCWPGQGGAARFPVPPSDARPTGALRRCRISTPNPGRADSSRWSRRPWPAKPPRDSRPHPRRRIHNKRKHAKAFAAFVLRVLVMLFWFMLFMQ